MLQAIVKNKAREFLLGGDQRRPVEDIMTACVFGGLRYLAPEVAGAARPGCWATSSRAASELSDVQLWPRRDGVEPDVVLLCHLPSGRPLHVVVERKWATNIGPRTGREAARSLRRATSGLRPHVAGLRRPRPVQGGRSAALARVSLISTYGRALGMRELPPRLLG